MALLPIASQIVSTPVNQVQFTSIPTSVNGVTIRDLLLIGSNMTASLDDSIRVRLNNASSTNTYPHLFMLGSGSSSGQSGSNNGNAWFIQDGNLATNQQDMVVMHILDFTQTDKHKTALWRYSNGFGPYAYAARWADTSAVVSLQIFLNTQNFNAGSRFDLYGVQA